MQHEKIVRFFFHIEINREIHSININETFLKKISINHHDPQLLNLEDWKMFIIVFFCFVCQQ